MRLVHFIFALCLFTASFDLILGINVGARLHIAQVLSIPFCLAGLARVAQQGRVVWSRNATYLALWVFVQFLFLPLSGNIAIGVQFLILLMLVVSVWFAAVELYGEGLRVQSLMGIYLWSYVFVAAFGMIQFLLPLAGLPGILVRQWVIHGRLARINGFNDEPSYYVTYLMMGWITLVDLRVSKAQITSGKFWKWATVLVAASLFLSTSKAGWGVMFVELVARMGPRVWRFARSLAGQAERGSMKVVLPRLRVVVAGVLVVSASIFGAQYLFLRVNPLTFLQGTGLAGTASHSLSTRTDEAMATLSAFLDHPIVGRSLGGVSVHIATQAGVIVNGMDEARLYWGFPVLLDVLVASGAIGFIPFLLFLNAHTFGAMRMARRYWPDERAKWLRALGRAMIFEWLMLMVDQNLLRIYLWFHFAIIAVVAYQLEHSPALALAPERVAPSQPSLESGGGEMVPTA